jgi:exodeoxyribonuclease-3
MFRHFYPDQLDTYSWWSYRAGARGNNVGWRIDYFVLNNEFAKQAKDIRYLNEVMGSDHCPVLLEL